MPKFDYNGVEIKAIDFNHAGRLMCELDGKEVFSGNGKLVVIKDNKVIDRFSNTSMYEFFTLYAHDRREYLIEGWNEWT